LQLIRFDQIIGLYWNSFNDSCLDFHCIFWEINKLHWTYFYWNTVLVRCLNQSKLLGTSKDLCLYSDWWSTLDWLYRLTLHSQPHSILRYKVSTTVWTHLIGNQLTLFYNYQWSWMAVSSDNNMLWVDWMEYWQHIMDLLLLALLRIHWSIEIVADLLSYLLWTCNTLYCKD
jgi:hypothetical protein